MASDDVESEINQLHPLVIRELAADYVKLLRHLLGRDREVASASINGDLDRVRRQIEECMHALQDSVAGTLNDKLKQEWFDGRGGLLIFNLIEDALRCARLGHRHWLTKLPMDEYSKTSSKDVPRGIIEARSAALLQAYGNKNARREVSDRIATILNQSGFTTRCGRPAAATVTGWLKVIKRCAVASHRKNASKFHQSRYEYFEQDRLRFTEMRFNDALSLLEQACCRFSHRLIGVELPHGSILGKDRG